MDGKAQFRSTTSVAGSAVLRPNCSAPGCCATASKCSHRHAVAAASENVAVKSREVARIEMPAPLRRERRLLGELLGQALAEYGGPGLLADVENLRSTVIFPPTSYSQPTTPRHVP